MFCTIIQYSLLVAQVRRKGALLASELRALAKRQQERKQKARIIDVRADPGHFPAVCLCCLFCLFCLFLSVLLFCLLSVLRFIHQTSSFQFIIE